MIQGLTKQIQNIKDENFEEIFDRALKLNDNIGIKDDFIKKRKKNGQENRMRTIHVRMNTQKKFFN